jgi:hypothetical protein
MTETANQADVIAATIEQWARNWQVMADASSEMGETWSKSMLPIILARASEKRAGLGDELGDAIERLAQGPKLADVWDIDRKFMSALAAWSKMRQRLVAYNANASRPWMRALERYNAARKERGGDGKDGASRSWRDDFAAWSTLANEEMIRNQRSEEFLAAQRELLQAGTEFRRTQVELTDMVAKLFGVPTQRDFGDITQQLTELRREVRALARRVPASDDALSPTIEGQGR